MCVCVREGVLLQPYSLPPSPLPFKRRGDLPLKCFYTDCPLLLGSFIDALFCLSSLMRLSALPRQPAHWGTLEEHKWVILPSSTLLSSELHLHWVKLKSLSDLCPASCTSAAGDTMQVKIMEPGGDWAACMRFSLLPIIPSTGFTSREWRVWCSAYSKPVVNKALICF